MNNMLLSQQQDLYAQQQYHVNNGMIQQHVTPTQNYYNPHIIPPFGQPLPISPTYQLSHSQVSNNSANNNPQPPKNLINTQLKRNIYEPEKRKVNE